MWIRFYTTSENVRITAILKFLILWNPIRPLKPLCAVLRLWTTSSPVSYTHLFVFNIQQIEGKTLETHSESLDFLKELGFKVSPWYHTFSKIEDVLDDIEKIGEARGSFSFDTDGAVVKVNSLQDRELLGATAKYPKWAVAFKYPPEEKETTLQEIEISVGPVSYTHLYFMRCAISFMRRMLSCSSSI